MSIAGVGLVEEVLSIGFTILKVVAFVAALAALTAGFVFVIGTLVEGGEVALPEGVLAVLSSIIPTHTVECISVLITGKIAAFVYDWHLKIADKRSS